MNFHLRTPNLSDAPAISNLVQSSFRQLVAPDWEEPAPAVFISETTKERMLEHLNNAAFAAVAESKNVNGQSPAILLGFILLTKPNVLSYLFVDASSHRQGIAKALWCSARAHIAANYHTISTVELNATPYAVPAYQALGFYHISSPFKLGGCVATRMACWLPETHLQ